MTKPVVLNSSILQDYSYDDKSYTLTVTFKNGNKFQYFNILPPVMSGVFDGGGSIGSRFTKQIARSYPFVKVAPSEK